MGLHHKFDEKLERNSKLLSTATQRSFQALLTVLSVLTILVICEHIYAHLSCFCCLYVAYGGLTPNYDNAESPAMMGRFDVSYYAR